MEGERPDGRNRDDIRPLFLQVGMINDARGSAYIEAGQTKLTCSVYGPKEIVRRSEYSVSGIIKCEFTFAPFSSKVHNDEEQQENAKEYTFLLQKALESVVCLHKFPQSQLDVCVTVLEDGGSALSIAITAAGAALMNSQVDMYDSIVGCTLVHAGDLHYLDPTIEEEKDALGSEKKSIVTIGMLPHKRQVALFSHEGSIECHELIAMTKLLSAASSNIAAFVNNTLKENSCNDRATTDDDVKN